LKDNHTLGSGLKKNVEEGQAIRFKKTFKKKKNGLVQFLVSKIILK